MHWKDRRTLLAEICGLPEDKQLLATAPQFAELTEKVGRRTVDEYKSVLMKQRKDMNANLNTLAGSRGRVQPHGERSWKALTSRRRTAKATVCRPSASGCRVSW